MPGNQTSLASDLLLAKSGRRLPRLLQAAGRTPQIPDLIMLNPRSNLRTALRASRPALSDLRFKGDACVTGVAVCLGDYQLTRVDLTPLDVPALNRAFLQVRTGQARRNKARRANCG